MKKIVLGLIVCSFLVLPAVCLGATGWYGGVKAGVALASDSDISITGLPTVQTCLKKHSTVTTKQCL